MSDYIPDPIERMEMAQDRLEDECFIDGVLVCIECKKPETKDRALFAASESPSAPPVCADCFGFDPFDAISKLP